MKIKSDFITNSSSSSFIAWGVSIDDIPFAEDILLSIYDERLSYLESMKKQDKDKFLAWYEDEYNELISLETDEEKIEWADDQDFDSKVSSLMDGYSWTSQEYINAIGISPESMIKKYPDLKLKEIKSQVAKDLNKSFGTKFTEEDISYYEEVWFDG